MRADTFGIAAPVDEDRISVFGSSVANGQGAEGFRGYRYLYGELLRRRHADGLSPNAFYTSNVSIGGNTTQSLLGRYDDLVRDFGRYVIFGLSLGNEGIHGAAAPEAVFARWRDNMLRLIDKARADGKIPVVMNNYTRGDYDEANYGYVRRLNLLIHEWPVPSFNCLGSIDNGRGTLQSAAGAVSEGWHYVTLTSYYVQRRTLLYVGCCRLRELFFWRSAMTPDEVAAVCVGRMLKSSLEIYVPLAEGRAPLNRAQSTNAVRLLPDGGASASAGLRQ